MYSIEWIYNESGQFPSLPSNGTCVLIACTNDEMYVASFDEYDNYFEINTLSEAHFYDDAMEVCKDIIELSGVIAWSYLPEFPQSTNKG